MVRVEKEILEGREVSWGGGLVGGTKVGFDIMFMMDDL
jgi:hypothetical protein